MRKLIFLVFMCACHAVILGQSPYFQQDVAYDIDVRLDDKSHQLHGFEKLTYYNNSPDTLSFLYYHLWPNAYSNKKTAFARQKLRDGSARFRFAKQALLGGIDSLDFKIGEQQLEWGLDPRDPDIAWVMLDNPLPPGNKVVVTTPFRVDLPASFSRLGHVRNQYQLTQWYPKPAVYDREGWHPMPYLDQGEFYSEFGTFDVKISVPGNYVVGATGDLPDGDPEYEWLAMREKLSLEKLGKMDNPDSFAWTYPEGAYKTLHFHQEHVHDFAWFCDRQYYVLTDSVELPSSGNKVQVVAMFNERDRKLWAEAPKYLKRAVWFYSKMSGDYPYRHATAVDGALSAGAGMEYPNITVVGAGGGAESLELVIAHEVGHNWFYGMLGSNERDFPWMDEGINSYYEEMYWMQFHQDTMEAFFPNAISKPFGIRGSHRFQTEATYRIAAEGNADQPISTSSEDFMPFNYGAIAYAKTALAFRYLEGYLGRSVMERCLHRYFQEWKFRHPGPEDIRAVFELESGKDLGWFFETYLNGRHKLDFHIRKIKDGKLVLENNSNIAAPAEVTLYNESGKVVESIWTEPFWALTEIDVSEYDFEVAKVNGQAYIPEFRQERNRYRTGALFPKARPLSLKFLYHYGDPDKVTLNWLPVVGYNTKDGFMAGMLIHQNFYPRKGFAFHAMPMYGFESNRLTGSAGLTFRIRPASVFRVVELQNRTQVYSTLFRSRNKLEFELAHRGALMKSKHRFGIKGWSTGSRTGAWEIAPEDFYLPVFSEAYWVSNGSNGIFGWGLKGAFGFNAQEDIYRTDVEASMVWVPSRRWNIKLRGFSGVFLNQGSTPNLLRYGLAGSGDPFGDNILLDRAGEVSWLSQQVVRDHGAFSTLMPERFDRWIAALNGSIKLPYVPLRLFGDIGAGDSDNTAATTLLYDAGLRVNLLNGVLMVNFPLAGSIYEDNIPADWNELSRNITFTFAPGKLLKVLGRGIPGL